MAIRVRCRCGKSLKISSKFADKKIKCPACEKPFRVSAERFREAARRAQAKRASSAAESAVAPTAQPVVGSDAQPDAQPAALDDLLLADSHSQSDVLDLKPTIEMQATALPAVAVDQEAEVDMGYARDPEKRSSSVSKFNSVAAPQRSFWSDAGVAFVYPVMNANNAINYIILSLIVCVDLVFDFIPLGCIGLICSAIIFGWEVSVYLSVVGETGIGSDDLPANNLTGGMYDGVIRPALFFLGAFAIVLAPAAFLVIFGAMGLLPDVVVELSPVWVAAGIFLFPISLMLFAFEAPSVMFRPDLICTTIARTILPYLAIWILLLVVAALRTGLEFGNLVITHVPSLAGLEFVVDLSDMIVGAIILKFVAVYLWLIAMRLIGLYYLHFKKRFTFKME